MVIPFLKRTKPEKPRADGHARQEAFSARVRPHLAGLYRLAYRFTGRQHEAEDLLQELLTRLYARSERLEEIETLRPWLARALYNLYIDERRRHARSPLGHLQQPSAARPEEDSLPASPDEGADLDFCAEQEQMREHLGELVAQLPQEQREVVILLDVEGYEQQEVAAILDIPIGTVKSRLHRAHDRLREWLRQRNLFPSNVVLRGEGSIGEPPGLSVVRVSNDEM